MIASKHGPKVASVKPSTNLYISLRTIKKQGTYSVTKNRRNGESEGETKEQLKRQTDLRNRPPSATYSCPDEHRHSEDLGGRESSDELICLQS